MANNLVPSKRKRAETWTDSETNALISLWSAYNVDLKTAKRNRHVYETIAQRFNLQNDGSRTWEEVKTKITNLAKEYRREKMRESMGFASDWRFWMQVSSIFASEPKGDDVILPDDVECEQESKPDGIGTSLDVPVITDVQSLFLDYGDPSTLQDAESTKQSANGLSANKKRKKHYTENEKYIELLKELVQQQKHFQEEQQTSDQTFLALVQETVLLHNRSLVLQEKLFDVLTGLKKKRTEVKKEEFSFERRISEFQTYDDSRYMTILKELIQQQGQYHQDQQKKDKAFVSSMQEMVTLQKKSFSLQEKTLTLLKGGPQK